MRTLKDFINEQKIVTESTGDNFVPNLSSHAKCYNNLLKWYDKCITKMNKDEVISLLEYAVEQWKHDNFDTI